MLAAKKDNLANESNCRVEQTIHLNPDSSDESQPGYQNSERFNTGFFTDTSEFSDNSRESSVFYL